MDRGSPNIKSNKVAGMKYVSLERKMSKAHKEDIRSMMTDPAMRHLSGTWMGAFYTQDKSEYVTTAIV